MSAERESYIQKQDHEKIKDSLYGDIDVKIGLVKNLLLIASELPIPRSTQTPEEIKAENKLLNSVAEEAIDLFPNDYIKLQLLNTLYMKQEALIEPSVDDEELQTCRLENQQEYEILDDEIRELEANPRVIFLDALGYGVGNLISNRNKLRELQKIKKSLLNEEGWVNNPEDYAEHNDIQPTFVQYRRFSLGKFFDPSDYSKLTNSYTSYGMHEKGINTYILHQYLTPEEDLLSSIFMGMNAPKYITDKNLITAAHEEAHAFIEGFRNLYSLTTLGKSERFLTHDIRSEIRAYQSNLRSTEEVKLTRRMKQLSRLSSEELLAELFSDIDRTQIPISTFKNIQNRTKIAIEKMFISNDSKVDQIIRDNHSRINFELIKQKIRDCYAKIELNCPEKRIDLDIAFALFPPSKIFRVENLVDRWINQAQQEDRL